MNKGDAQHVQLDDNLEFPDMSPLVRRRDYVVPHNYPIVAPWSDCNTPLWSAQNTPRGGAGTARNSTLHDHLAANDTDKGLGNDFSLARTESMLGYAGGAGRKVREDSIRRSFERREQSDFDNSMKLHMKALALSPTLNNSFTYQHHHQAPTEGFSGERKSPSVPNYQSNRIHSNEYESNYYQTERHERNGVRNKTPPSEYADLPTSLVGVHDQTGARRTHLNPQHEEEEDEEEDVPESHTRHTASGRFHPSPPIIYDPTEGVYHPPLSAAKPFAASPRHSKNDATASSSSSTHLNHTKIAEVFSADDKYYDEGGASESSSMSGPPPLQLSDEGSWQIYRRNKKISYDSLKQDLADIEAKLKATRLSWSQNTSPQHSTNVWSMPVAPSASHQHLTTEDGRRASVSGENMATVQPLSSGSLNQCTRNVVNLEEERPITGGHSRGSPSGNANSALRGTSGFSTSSPKLISPTKDDHLETLKWDYGADIASAREEANQNAKDAKEIRVVSGDVRDSHEAGNSSDSDREVDNTLSDAHPLPVTNYSTEKPSPNGRSNLIRGSRGHFYRSQGSFICSPDGEEMGDEVSYRPGNLFDVSVASQPPMNLRDEMRLAERMHNNGGDSLTGSQNLRRSFSEDALASLVSGSEHPSLLSSHKRQDDQGNSRVSLHQVERSRSTVLLSRHISGGGVATSTRPPVPTLHGKDRVGGKSRDSMAPYQANHSELLDEKKGQQYNSSAHTDRFLEENDDWKRLDLEEDWPREKDDVVGNSGSKVMTDRGSDVAGPVQPYHPPHTSTSNGSGSASRLQTSRSTTTMESSHQGSDDAVPPVFPSFAYGSRVENSRSYPYHYESLYAKMSRQRDAYWSGKNDELKQSSQIPQRHASHRSKYAPNSGPYMDTIFSSHDTSIPEEIAHRNMGSSYSTDKRRLEDMETPYQDVIIHQNSKDPHQTDSARSDEGTARSSDRLSELEAKWRQYRALHAVRSKNRTHVPHEQLLDEGRDDFQAPTPMGGTDNASGMHYTKNYSLPGSDQFTTTHDIRGKRLENLPPRQPTGANNSEGNRTPRQSSININQRSRYDSGQYDEGGMEDDAVTSLVSVTGGVDMGSSLMQQHHQRNHKKRSQSRDSHSGHHPDRVQRGNGVERGDTTPPSSCYDSSINEYGYESNRPKFSQPIRGQHRDRPSDHKPRDIQHSHDIQDSFDLDKDEDESVEELRDSMDTVDLMHRMTRLLGERALRGQNHKKSNSPRQPSATSARNSNRSHSSRSHPRDTNHHHHHHHRHDSHRDPYSDYSNRRVESSRRAAWQQMRDDDPLLLRLKYLLMKHKAKLEKERRREDMRLEKLDYLQGLLESHIHGERVRIPSAMDTVTEYSLSMDEDVREDVSLDDRMSPPSPPRHAERPYSRRQRGHSHTSHDSGESDDTITGVHSTRDARDLRDLPSERNHAMMPVQQRRRGDDEMKGRMDVDSMKLQRDKCSSDVAPSQSRIKYPIPQAWIIPPPPPRRSAEKGRRYEHHHERAYSPTTRVSRQLVDEEFLQQHKQVKDKESQNPRVSPGGIFWYVPVKDDGHEDPSHENDLSSWSSRDQDVDDMKLSHSQLRHSSPHNEERSLKHHESAPSQWDSQVDRMSLQDAFEKRMKRFISRSRERQKRIKIAAEERRYMTDAEKQRAKLFTYTEAGGGKRRRGPNLPDPLADYTYPGARRRKYQPDKTLSFRKRVKLLPEVQQKMMEEKKTAREQANRIRRQMYGERILRSVLRKRGPWVSHS